MWYAIYVKSRHEKKVVDQLKEKGIEAYVPLKKTLKQWTDRKKWIEEPVITCYVFVNIEGSQRESVLQTKGVVGYVRSNRKDARVSDEEMQIMKSILSESELDVSIETNNFCIGQLCEVVVGPLKGKKVKLFELRGKKKVGVFLQDLKMGLIVDISPSCLKILK
jgi:transcription antitermination factor NusG